MMVTGHVLNMTGKIFENFVGKSVPETVTSFRWKFVPRLFKTVYSILNCFLLNLVTVIISKFALF